MEIGMEQARRDEFRTSESAATNIHDLTIPHALTEKYFGDRPVLQVECNYVDGALNGRSKAVVAVDVRSPLAFWRGHLPGAINIPADQSFAGALSGLPKAGEIILYGSGADHDEALKVASVLTNCDRQIRIMRGGIARWLEQGFSIARPRQEPDRIAAF